MKKARDRRQLFSGSLKILGGLSFAALLWRARIVQVGAFAAAAAVDSRLGFHRSRGPAARSDDWFSEQQTPSPTPYPLNFSALISYHPEYQDFIPQMAVASLEAAMGLGFGWIRSDIRWREVLPKGDQADKKAISWYKNFLLAASGRGLKNMVVLSSPPKAVLQQDLHTQHVLWERFVQTVVENLGAECHSYQLMNEPNNPIYRFFDLQNTAKAIVRAASVIRKAQQSPIAINISTDLWGWQTYLNRLLGLSGEAVNIVGLDHYPGTWSLGLNHGWADILRIAETIASAAPHSVWFNRRLAILETGYSTNAPLRNQAAQAKYFENLGSLLSNLKKVLASNGNVLLGIYELSDANSSVFLDPEAHFGIFTSDLRPKLALQAVKKLIGT